MPRPAKETTIIYPYKIGQADFNLETWKICIGKSLHSLQYSPVTSTSETDEDIKKRLAFAKRIYAIYTAQ